MDDRSGSVAEYLTERLKELGVRHIFAVPGTYCADFLFTLAEDRKQNEDSGRFIDYVGVSSEKEASNAADGYFRASATSQVGVVCVTYGVGPFNLLDGIAGAYTEKCPIVLINGGPSRGDRRMLEEHGIYYAHATGRSKSDFIVLQEITVDKDVIDTPEDAPAKIDRLLLAAINHSAPVYIEVAHDVWKRRCPRPRGPLVRTAATADAEQLAAAIDEAEYRIVRAKLPIVLGGEEIHRFRLQRRFQSFVVDRKFGWTTTMLGKSILPESVAGFIGTYDSDFSPEAVRKIIDASDCVLALGATFGDFYKRFVVANAGELLIANSQHVRIGPTTYQGVSLGPFLEGLDQRLDQIGYSAPSLDDERRDEVRARLEGKRTFAVAQREQPPDADAITYESFFQRLATFMDESTITMCDTSLALFPAADLVIKRQGGFISQATWLSIGYTIGAALGVGAALEGSSSRAIVVIGDGGLQMNPQALSAIIRRRHPTIVFVLNNGSYGVEQFLVDKTFFSHPGASPTFFCKLDAWDYKGLVDVFRGGNPHACGYQADTLPELDDVFLQCREAEFGPVVVDVRIPPTDLPPENRPAS